MNICTTPIPEMVALNIGAAIDISGNTQRIDSALRHVADGDVGALTDISDSMMANGLLAIDRAAGAITDAMAGAAAIRDALGTARSTLEYGRAYISGIQAAALHASEPLTSASHAEVSRALRYMSASVVTDLRTAQQLIATA